MLSVPKLAMLVAGALVVAGCAPANRNKKRAKSGGDLMGGGGGLDALAGGGGGGATGKYTLSATTAASALTQLTTDPIDEERPMLSPDGGALLVGLRARDTKTTSYPGIIAVSPNGGAARTFLTQPGTEASRAAWVPDGSTFVYTTNAPGELTLVRANSRSPGAGYTIIASSQIAPWADYPSVAPDGLVAVTVEVQKLAMIATVRMDGSNYQLVQQGTHAAFSPDGKRMVFSRMVGNNMQLFVSDRSGGSVAQLTYGKAYAMWPSWSPDGQFVVFASNKGLEHLPEAQQLAHIFVVRATGGGVTQLTSGTADCGFPSWGADGNVYFNSDQAGNYDIWRVRPVLAAVGSAI